MNTHVAKLIAFNVLLKITDLLAPNANTQVISRVMPNAIKSGGRPVGKKQHWKIDQGDVRREIASKDAN